MELTVQLGSLCRILVAPRSPRKRASSPGECQRHLGQGKGPFLQSTHEDSGLSGADINSAWAQLCLEVLVPLVPSHRLWGGQEAQSGSPLSQEQRHSHVTTPTSTHHARTQGSHPSWEQSLP